MRSLRIKDSEMAMQAATLTSERTGVLHAACLEQSGEWRVEPLDVDEVGLEPPTASRRKLRR